MDEAMEELNDFNDFYMEISELSPKEMIEKVEERYPEFIEHIDAMENPPSSALEFWSGFGIWSISRLHDKYYHIWKQVIEAYFKSDVRQESRKKWALRGKVNSQIEKILKNSSF